MFYLIANQQIVQTSAAPFPTHDDLIWIESGETPAGHVAVFRDGDVTFQQIESSQNQVFPDMETKPARDVIFCLGKGGPNMGFVNPNTDDGYYNQCCVLLAGSGYACDINDEGQMVLDKIGHLYDLSRFKAGPIKYNSYDDGTEWVAVNPINDAKIDVQVLAGPVNVNITDNHNGITVFNVKGQNFINGTVLASHYPVFYHADTNIDVQVADGNYVIVIRYQQPSEPT